MWGKRKKEMHALVDLAESAHNAFVLLLELADREVEERPQLAIQCLFRANQLADSANTALRVAGESAGNWTIPAGSLPQEMR